MSIRIQLNHTTRYNYSAPVFIAPQHVRLRPAPHCRMEIEHYTLKVEPTQHYIHWQQDPFNNYVARLVFPDKTNQLALHVEIIANIVEVNPYDFFIEDYATPWPFFYNDELSSDLSSYRDVPNLEQDVKDFITEIGQGATTTMDFLLALNKGIYNRVAYAERLEPGVQTCATTLASGCGSCRDFAWMLVQAFRYYGLASRFVSGYSVQLADHSVPSINQQQDSTDLHAWTEVFIPGAGWVGLDPSAGTLAGAGYIPLCCTRSPAAAAPVSGLTDACETAFSFSNKIVRLG